MTNKNKEKTFTDIDLPDNTPISKEVVNKKSKIKKSKIIDKIEVRIQLSKNFQTIELKSVIKFEHWSIAMPQIQTMAKQELLNIADIDSKSVAEEKTIQHNNQKKYIPNNNNNNNNNNEKIIYAKTSKGIIATSSDNVPLTKEEIKKCYRNNIKQYWLLPKNIINMLE